MGPYRGAVSSLATRSALVRCLRAVSLARRRKPNFIAFGCRGGAGFSAVQPPMGHAAQWVRGDSQTAQLTDILPDAQRALCATTITGLN